MGMIGMVLLPHYAGRLYSVLPILKIRSAYLQQRAIARIKKMEVTMASTIAIITVLRPSRLNETISAPTSHKGLTKTS